MKRLERAKRIEKALINMSDTKFGTWYAIHNSEEDNDDGLGSLIPLEAAKMAVGYGSHVSVPRDFQGYGLKMEQVEAGVVLFP